MSIGNLSYIDELIAVGLNKYEAVAYVALLKKNNAPAIEIANRSGIPKQRIYDILDNLQTKGLCSIREGRPRFYTAYQPQQALPALLNYRKQQQAAENERQARLIKKLIPSLSTVLNGENHDMSSPSQNKNKTDACRDIGGL